MELQHKLAILLTAVVALAGTTYADGPTTAQQPPAPTPQFNHHAQHPNHNLPAFNPYSQFQSSPPPYGSHYSHLAPYMMHPPQFGAPFSGYPAQPFNGQFLNNYQPQQWQVPPQPKPFQAYQQQNNVPEQNQQPPEHKPVPRAANQGQQQQQQVPRKFLRRKRPANVLAPAAAAAATPPAPAAGVPKPASEQATVVAGNGNSFAMAGLPQQAAQLANGKGFSSLFSNIQVTNDEHEEHNSDKNNYNLSSSQNKNIMRQYDNRFNNEESEKLKTKHLTHKKKSKTASSSTGNIITATNKNVALSGNRHIVNTKKDNKNVKNVSNHQINSDGTLINVGQVDENQVSEVKQYDSHKLNDDFDDPEDDDDYDDEFDEQFQPMLSGNKPVGKQHAS